MTLKLGRNRADEVMIQTPLRAFRGRGLARPLKNVDAVAVAVEETRKRTVDSMMMQTRMKMTMQG